MRLSINEDIVDFKEEKENVKKFLSQKSHIIIAQWHDAKAYELFIGCLAPGGPWIWFVTI